MWMEAMDGPPETLFLDQLFWMQIAAPTGAALIFVLLVTSGKSIVMSRTFQILAALTIFGFFFRAKVHANMFIQEWSKVGHAYAITEDGRQMCIELIWMLPAVGALAASFRLRATLRASAWDLVLLLAICASAALAMFHLASMSFTAFHGHQRIPIALFDKWGLTQLVRFSVDACCALALVFVYINKWPSRYSVASARTAILIMLAIEISHHLFLHPFIVRRLSGENAYWLALREQLHWAALNLAAFIPALTWPRAACRAE